MAHGWTIPHLLLCLSAFPSYKLPFIYNVSFHIFHDFPIVFPSQSSINIGCPHRNSNGNSAKCPIQSSSSLGNVRQMELDRWMGHIYRRALLSSSELWTLLHDLGASKASRDGKSDGKDSLDIGKSWENP